MLVDDVETESLPETECRALLGHGGLGHVALTMGGLPTVLCTPFAAVDDALVFVVEAGDRLCAALDGAVLALEADVVRRDGSPWGVVAIGTARELGGRLEVEDAAAAFGLDVRDRAARRRFFRLVPTLVSSRRASGVLPRPIATS